MSWETRLRNEMWMWRNESEQLLWGGMERGPFRKEKMCVRYVRVCVCISMREGKDVCVCETENN